jgi:outer membrane immunogenic protein
MMFLLVSSRINSLIFIHGSNSQDLAFMVPFSRAPLVVASACLLVATLPTASAQDRSLKTKIVAPAAAAAPLATSYSWTGFYLGVSAGLNGGNYQYKPVEVEALSAGEPQEPTQNRIRNSASGSVFGVQGGYLYQLTTNFVLGVEADYNWTDYRSSMAASEIASVTISGSSASTAESEVSKLRGGGFGTLRGRVGYAFGPVLPYITGGVALGRTSFLFAEGAEEAGQPPIAKRGRTTWGYTLGAGLEYAITPALRFKTEYLYTSFANFQAVGLENTSFKLGTHFNMVRVGLNYSFGNNTAIVPTLLVANSTKPRFEGFSVGVNAGIAAASSVERTTRVEQSILTLASNSSFQLSGTLIGAEIGYQYQLNNNLVLGAFADYQFDNYQNLANEAEVNTEESAKEKKRFSIPQFGTVRLRAGYAIGSFLPYVTGGLAYGRVEYRQTEVPIEEGANPGRLNQNKLGYALGIGAEYAITSQLFFKTEYLYVNLGQIKGTVASGDTVSASMPMNIGRVGLTYRF